MFFDDDIASLDYQVLNSEKCKVPASADLLFTHQDAGAPLGGLVADKPPESANASASPHSSLAGRRRSRDGSLNGVTVCTEI
jgi:hypothetical protein